MSVPDTMNFFKSLENSGLQIVYTTLMRTRRGENI